jgi:hypothetical protein
LHVAAHPPTILLLALHAVPPPVATVPTEPAPLALLVLTLLVTRGLPKALALPTPKLALLALPLLPLLQLLVCLALALLVCLALALLAPLTLLGLLDGEVNVGAALVPRATILRHCRIRGFLHHHSLIRCG